VKFLKYRCFSVQSFLIIPKFHVMRADQAKTIPVDRYLECQGIRPINSRKGGKELWYISPIRSDDNNPSFKVDTILNCWFDYGVSLGGNTLDLAIKMLNDSTVSEALKHLESTRLYGRYRPTQTPRVESAEKKERNWNKKESNTEANAPFELLDQKPLKHPALLQYLEKRGIDLDVARKYLSQIDFKQPLSASSYFALGFPSGDGHEARNALFKGFVGTSKDITLLSNPDSPLLLVFEGFMDFLTYLTIKGLDEAPGSVIVLNSGNLRDRAIAHIRDERFNEVQLFLDNDPMGDGTVELYQQNSEAGRLHDMRTHYTGFSDLNEWHLKRKP